MARLARATAASSRSTFLRGSLSLPQKPTRPATLLSGLGVQKAESTGIGSTLLTMGSPAMFFEHASLCIGSARRFFRFAELIAQAASRLV